MDFTQLFIYFIIVKNIGSAYRLSGTNMQIIGIGYKKNQHRSITSCSIYIYIYMYKISHVLPSNGLQAIRH